MLRVTIEHRAVGIDRILFFLFVVAVVVFGREFLILLLQILFVLQPRPLALFVQFSIDLVHEFEAGGLGGLSEFLALGANSHKASVETDAIEEIDDQEVDEQDLGQGGVPGGG